MHPFLKRLHERALDVMSLGLPVDPLLTEFALALQDQLPGSVVGVAVLDKPGKTFRHAIFPTLDREFGLSLENNPITGNRGSCGMAIMTGRPVQVDDAATDERFSSEWKTLLHRHGLNALRSTPALCAHDAPQGCIAVMHATETTLDPQQLELVGLAAALFARICIYSRTRESNQLLLGELEHRMSNLYATIGGVASLTIKHHPDPRQFRDVLGSRLFMMHRAHLIATHATEMKLDALLQEVLAPYRDDHGFSISGPEILLAREAGSSFALVTHELATNAAKYGALSRPGGVVQITWSIAHAADDDGMAFSLEWAESGGPPVQPPSRKGYGTTMITGSLRNACDGKSSMHYDPAGFRCVIHAPFTPRLGREVKENAVSSDH